MNNEQKTKISLLIPVFNYDIVALAHSMKSAIGKVPELYEILIGDDASSPEYQEKYRALEGNGLRIISSEKNIGRASMRNKLALEAEGDYLLFMDADMMLPSTAESYLLKYISSMGTAQVICGGITYSDSPPGDPDKLLRWKYGKWREQKKASERNKHPHTDFSTFNVLIAKSVFSKIRFYEELKQYGHEDTLLSYQLKNAGIAILHIDNSLTHEGLESNREYLDKVKLSIENLSMLYDKVTDKQAFCDTLTMLRNYRRLSYLKLSLILAGVFIRYRERMEIALESGNKSNYFFVFYRMCMFCTYREIHMRKNIMAIF
jgi:glycosyltransferase involved in cell wall biosynthesis